jgi:hypothetical protein
MAFKCKVFWDDKEGKIKVELPITLQTSLVRVKDIDGNPIGSVRSQSLKEDWYVEWQISYFDENGQLVELGKMFELLATKCKAFTEAEIKELSRCLENRRVFFEETSFISMEKNGSFERFEGFTLLYRKTPILRKQLSDGSLIHIELRHKQKAVGYQAMLYIFVPIKNLVSNLDKSSLIGRPARQNETVVWCPTKEHITELMKAFSIMSKKHREDIMFIVRRFL